MGVASMKKWYFGVALVAGWLCQTGTASAQIPTPFGAARIPEPIPCANTPELLPGPIDQLFRNPPIGFEGNNGLWLQADRVNTEFRSQMWSTEVNYRYTNAAVLEAELILGVRYVDLWESLNRFTDDDGISNPDPFGNPDPLRQAFYLTEVHNRIVAPQIGFEWGKSATHWFTVGVNAKAALGVDFAE